MDGASRRAEKGESFLSVKRDATLFLRVQIKIQFDRLTIFA